MVVLPCEALFDFICYFCNASNDCVKRLSIAVCFSMRPICTSTARRYRVPRPECKLLPVTTPSSQLSTFKGKDMRVVVVVAAMLFCAPVFVQDVKLKSVTNSIGMKLIEIPAGKFTMGDGAGIAVTLT